MAAWKTDTPAMIWPVIIPGIDIKPRIDIPLMVGSIATRTDSIAIGFAASHRHAPYDSRVSMLSLCNLKYVKQADIARAVALMQLDNIMPTVGMNFVGFQKGVSDNPIFVPKMEIAMLLVPIETSTDSNWWLTIVMLID
jgi:hypothetical protein